MPKKKQTETQEEQSARFCAEVERLVAAGELNSTEAEGVLDELVKKVATTSRTDYQRRVQVLVLQINWAALPEAEHPFARHLEGQLHHLNFYAEEFGQALVLFDENYCNQTKDHKNIMSASSRMRMAAYFAVLQVYHIRDTLNSIRDTVGRCPTLKPKIDTKLMQNIYDDFEQNKFPELKKVRDGIGHFADRLYSPERIQKHAGEAGFIHGSLLARDYVFSDDGKYVSIEISEASYLKLTTIINQFHSAFSKLVRQVRQDRNGHLR